MCAVARFEFNGTAATGKQPARASCPIMQVIALSMPLALRQHTPSPSQRHLGPYHGGMHAHRNPPECSVRHLRQPEWHLKAGGDPPTASGRRQRQCRWLPPKAPAVRSPATQCQWRSEGPLERRCHGDRDH
jgi:hypothetical protein